MTQNPRHALTRAAPVNWGDGPPRGKCPDQIITKTTNTPTVLNEPRTGNSPRKHDSQKKRNTDDEHLCKGAPLPQPKQHNQAQGDQAALGA